MNKHIKISLPALLLAVLGYSISLAHASDARLNQSQLDYLNALINTQVKEQSDIDIINGWTEAQRAAEFICRPLAEKTIKEQFHTSDRIILDQGADNQQHLVSATMLMGKGLYREGMNWTPFHFQCEISETGEAVNFHIVKNTITMAPGPAINTDKAN